MRRIITISVCMLCLLCLLAGCQQFSELELPEIDLSELALPEIDLSGFTNPLGALVGYLNSTGIAEETLPEEAEEEYYDYEPYFGEVLYPELPQRIEMMEEESQVRLPTVYPLNIVGNMTLDSNYSVSLLIENIYKRFVKEGYQDSIQVNKIGMAKAVQLYCENDAVDITQTDRPMTRQEMALCVANGRLPSAFPIVTDAIAVVVHPDNDWVDDVSSEELAQLFRAERWSDVNEEWPDDRIIRFIPELESGITSMFARTVLEQDVSVLASLSNTTLHEDVLKIDMDMSRNSNSIGFLSYAYYLDNRDYLKLLSIDGGLPLYLPVEEYEPAEINEDYPLRFTQRLYADMNLLQVQDNVQAFINFAISHAQAEGLSAGYFPLGADLWDASKAKFLQGTIQNNLVAAGSAAVAPWVEMGYQQFKAKGYTTNLVVQREGSAAGITSFCEEDSKVDIAMASRIIRSEEAEICEDNGRQPFGIRIGSDMVAVAINRSNTFVKDVSLNQLGELFTAERWSDVDPDWPDEPIQRFIPGASSGAISLFSTRVLKGDTEALETASNTTLDDDEDILIDGIMSNVYSLGFMTYADYAKRSNDLSLMAINSVRPDAAIEEDKPYLLESPLNLYIDPISLQQNPQLTAFIAFQLENSDEYLAELGYVALNSRVKEEILRDFLRAFQQNDFP